MKYHTLVKKYPYDSERTTHQYNAIGGDPLLCQLPSLEGGQPRLIQDDVVSIGVKTMPEGEGHQEQHGAYIFVPVSCLPELMSQLKEMQESFTK